MATGGKGGISDHGKVHAGTRKRLSEISSKSPGNSLEIGISVDFTVLSAGLIPERGFYRITESARSDLATRGIPAWLS